MSKTLIGPKLRQLRRQKGETQAQMAKALGISASYVNLLENNQRSLSVQMLMALSDAYKVDWRELTNDDSARLVADLRHTIQDPIFGRKAPDLQEIRAAIDHAPQLVDLFLELYQSHRTALDKIMQAGSEQMPSGLMELSPETVIHDFFRDHENHFPTLEDAAERAHRDIAPDTDDIYSTLRNRLKTKHGITTLTRPIEEMGQSLRFYDVENAKIHFSRALDHPNRVFQMAHILGVVEFEDVIKELVDNSGIESEQGLARCQVELANYFAAAFLMPYEPFLEEAERCAYDIDQLAASLGVTFEQVCHRLTTMQREGARGVPFFFLRVDKAGNVTKRFNSTTFNLAEYGGACPVWNIHTAFFTPGVIIPQFVEMPDGQQFFTISRTAHRPVYSRETQDRRLALALGCDFKHAERLGYSTAFNFNDDKLFSPIGINCHLCPRQACSQRAHQPLFVELPIDANRRGNTRYES
ncbi:MAG: DUF2083 domain-containing protein [Litoreibacter sp.]|nr:DUF2083 domain-containing protein [Litoreibacter sp.]